MRSALLSLLGIAALLALGWILLTSLAPGDAIASWAPCPRNWQWAPAWLPRASPLASAAIRFERGHGKICYGRPSLRGRDMIGGDAVPFGRLWRTGANEPTTLHVDVPVEIGDLYLEPGSYSIYTVPGARIWEIVVNRSTRQWGLESLYDDEVAALELGRVRIPAETLERPVETLTLTPVPVGGDEWKIRLEWQTTRLRIPLRAATRPAFDELEPDDPGE